MSETFEIRVIGWARTPWTLREQAPYQPVAAPDSEGIIELAPEYREAIADVASFGRIWLIFSFHRSSGWGPKVRVPRGGPKRGVLATRAPNRPSQIGLTNVAVVSVDEKAGTIRVRGLDLLDGTPILDIKPYLPMVDSWPDAGHGWLEEFLQAGIEPKLKRPLKPRPQ